MAGSTSVARFARACRSWTPWLALVVLFPAALSAQTIRDVKGGADHPLVSRYAGAVMLGYRFRDFDELSIPLAPVEFVGGKYKAAKEQRVEGQATRMLYLVPAGRSPLEVQRNYEQELTQAGFQVLFRCAAAQCGGLRGENVANALYPPGGRLTYGNGSATDFAENALGASTRDGRYLALRRSGPDGEAYVSLFVGVNDLSVIPETHMRTMALLDVVVAARMETGMVTVDAATMAKEVKQSGHVALYGILFDTDRASVKPESEAALGEIAKLLKQNAALKLYVVGHTDNVGSLDHNMALSDQRAAAVVQALTNRHGVAAMRLHAVGVGPVAPVASNETDQGRAKNRRVELVVQ